jgi:hypothetical protein
MKLKVLPFLYGIFTGIVFLFVAHAFAWTNPPTGTPPNCPSGYPGCDAPLNVGGTAQHKTGPLAVNSASDPASGVALSVAGLGAFTSVAAGTLQVTGGSPSVGKVLTAVDGTGLAQWSAPGGGGTASVITIDLNQATTNLGVHTFCALGSIQYGFQTSIGNAIVSITGTAGGSWTASHSGASNGTASAICLN